MHVKAEYGWGKILLEIFEKTVEGTLIQPTFITDLSDRGVAAGARSDHDAEVTDRFELFVGAKEIANGFSELNDPEDQAERFRAQVSAKDSGDDEAMHFDADYIRALEVGLPPTGGLGVGIDRLVMLLTDVAVDPRRAAVSVHAAGSVIPVSLPDGPVGTNPVGAGLARAGLVL